MTWKVASNFIITAVTIIWMVCSEETFPGGIVWCQNHTDLFQNVTITSFIDENRYIRMNISWDKPKENFRFFEMEIDTDCDALYGEKNISVEQSYVIEPSLERLKYPAEPLLHGCKYNFELSTKIPFGNESCMLSEKVHYKIPECVADVCDCGVAYSPYELQDITLVTDHIYSIKFRKTGRMTDVNLETVFEKLWYTNANFDKTISKIHPEQISFDEMNNAFTVPFYDFHSGGSYVVNIDLVLDNCRYPYSTKIDVPKEIVNSYLIYMGVLCALFVGVAIVLLKTKPHIIEKIRQFLPFVPSSPPVIYSAEPSASVLKSTKEVISSQYTPLEFIENSHKFDHFEIPRNKISLKNEIGGGAFGKVYRAEVYELDNKPGYILAAAKKPMENAPAVEITDFLAEIETMKKIARYGGHPNVINILACVTIDFPYIMVMELVPCGSLKSHLSILRKEWEERKQRLRMQENNRHFFPDNMVVENYLPTVTVSQASETNKLKYSDLTFDDYTGSTHSSETNSYINPDTPTTPESPFITSSPTRRLSKQTRYKAKNKILPACLEPHSPLTPNSTTSSGLKSVTETILTSLDNSPTTPMVNVTENTTEKPVLNSKELQNFALQIANGMAFLERIDVTHRDLAARNILISEDKVLKISDFGMARVGVYVNTTKKRQPLRWMAPEAIEYSRCDNKTDVWSFGVVLWEIGSLGAFPYKDMSNGQVIAYVTRGETLERPETCTDQVYGLMQQCWKKKPEDRPTFEDIVKCLDENKGKIYVDFSKISPKYDFPPTQENT